MYIYDICTFTNNVFPVACQ